MTPTLQSIARAVGGRVVDDHVVAAYPGKSKRDRSVSIFINGDDIGVHLFRDGDPIAVKDHFRQVCGLPTWKPTWRKLKPQAPVSVRRAFLSETVRACRSRKKITPAAFGLLINDARVVGDERNVVKYAREFGFGPSDVERCMSTTPRHFTADERAKILNLNYAERQQLGLRRTGAIDVDRKSRERARRDRYNAKRRAKRHASREAAARLASIGGQVAERLEEHKQEGDFVDDHQTSVIVLERHYRSSGGAGVIGETRPIVDIGKSASTLPALPESVRNPDGFDQRGRELFTATGGDRRGRRSPETRSAIDARDRMCRAMKAAFYPTVSANQAALLIWQDLSRYREGAWRRDRTEPICFVRHHRRPNEFCYAILQCRDHVPSARTIRRAISTERIIHGQRGAPHSAHQPEI